MKHLVPEPNTSQAIGKLAGILAPDESLVLRTTYSFLRRVESVLRRVANSSVSQLPSNEEELRVLSVRLGFTGAQEFLAEYTAKRAEVEAIIQKHL